MSERAISPAAYRNPLQLRLLACVIAAASLIGCASTAQPHNPKPNATGVAAAINDLCDAQVVFLGEEGHHGGGQSIATKADLIAGLIRQCGFTHVALEAQIYDVLDLEKRYAAGTATPEALYDALGSLGFMAAQANPLLALLHEKASAGQVRLSGFDPNIGNITAYYAQNQLAQDLSRDLPAKRRDFCTNTIETLTQWKFDDAHPNDEAFTKAIHDCAIEIEALALQQAAQDPLQYRIAHNFRSQLEQSEGDGANWRDRAMYENLQWALDRQPAGTRTVVWTASVHALKQPLGKRKSMASYFKADSGIKMKSVAIVGAAGEYGFNNRVTSFLPADADSLEGSALASGGMPPVYLDAAALRKLGSRKSRMLSYDKYSEQDWSQWVDAVLVLSAEVAPTRARPNKPLQKP